VDSNKNNKSNSILVLCFSHLRWNFVYQRPQHLLTRCAAQADVHMWEEPLFELRDRPALARSIGRGGVTVLTPMLSYGLDNDAVEAAQRSLLSEYLSDRSSDQLVAWYYTPMALKFSDHLVPDLTVYDCMDELSAFQGASPDLVEQERRLFERADVVFAGGASLYASKRALHANVHLFPSSIDREHFMAARRPQTDPQDQAGISHPRIGFFGVIDERLDRDLLREVAAQHSDWQFVMIGPVVKIRQDELPRGANIHYLGQKEYETLPAYLSGWDAAMLPFAQNSSTRFISPTKTPEYLAAGKHVVATPIHDVVRPYGEMGLVKIAADAEEFGASIKACLNDQDEHRLAKVDKFLSGISWDKTFKEMWEQIDRCLPSRLASFAPGHRAEERSRSDV
jgi:glycosyltransferase involved in cell wall biosynthesis